MELIGDLYTSNSALATFDEDKKGSITVVKMADLAVFNRNLVELGNNNPKRILDAEVLYTVVGGEIVYEKGQE